MWNPIKTCRKCGGEFRLDPSKPGFADICPECGVLKPKKLTKAEKMQADLDRITRMPQLGSTRDEVAYAVIDFVKEHGQK